MESANALYFELKRLVEREGLLDPAPGFYIRRGVVTLALLVASFILVCAAPDNFWLQMANAALLAFTFGQGGFFMHDVAHGQVVNARWQRPMHIFLNLLFLWNTDWWRRKHNQHHATPNVPGYDGDIAVGPLVFSKEQALEKSGLYRLIARYQHLLFFPLLFGEAGHLRCAIVADLFKRRRAPQARVDIALLGLHAAVYLGVLFLFLPPWYALAFIAVHNGLLGLYLGVAFAPNHTGMPLFEYGAVADSLRQQVLTARNVNGGWVVDVFFGGLNFQIEHHLFLRMPRPRLRKTAPIVRRFCEERGIPYRAVSLWESYRQIFAYLYEMARCVA